MTIKSNYELKCTECGVITETQIWNTLNATIDPEDKQLLLQGKINLFECKSCGHQAWINSQLLFHEMNQHYIVYLFYPEQIESTKFLDSFSKDGRFHEDPGFDTSDIPRYFKNPHYVFSMYELINYVEFRDKLFAYKNQNKTKK
jgi:hypothetical protein